MDVILKNLSYTYHRGHVEALKDVNAHIGPGIYLLLGENGAGKTTMLRIMAGLLFASEGVCTLDGEDVRRRRPSTTSRTVYLDSEEECPARSIAEFAGMQGQFYPNFDPEVMARNLEAMRLNATDRVSSLSMGSRRKAMTAYTLALGADLTLLDEPTNGLDIEAKIALQRLMAANVRPDQSIVISTHNIADLESLYDGVIILRGARLVLCARVDDILDRLAFVTGAMKPDGALHAELYNGQWHAIVERGGGEDFDGGNDVDFRLLYTAMRSDNAQRIIDIINAKKSDNE